MLFAIFVSLFVCYGALIGSIVASAVWRLWFWDASHCRPEDVAFCGAVAGFASALVASVFAWITALKTVL